MVMPVRITKYVFDDSFKFIRHKAVIVTSKDVNDSVSMSPEYQIAGG